MVPGTSRWLSVLQGLGQAGTMTLKPPLAGIPAAPVPIPAAVAREAGGEELEAVWINEVGGTSFRIGADTTAERYIKYAPVGTEDTDFAAEAQRLGWAGAHAIVPRVLEVGGDAAGNWLLTAALRGESAVAPGWIPRPAMAARALGSGLRALHEALPVHDCPFESSLSERVKDLERRIERPWNPADWPPGYSLHRIETALELLRNPPVPAVRVVCHGDVCAPNTLLDEQGNFAGHVDLGSLGVADRWADLAVAAWSTEWNYGRGYEELVYAGYGIAPDTASIAYYRLLWDLG
ncbi:Aminoglycoside 3'-phosphotransferase [Paeniglutamicibacter gangotriensis Lz1y]|uniref:Aminoglycoside 3'-phosphotransferase n=2 Tax=Paeniglutamicibacter gangotriensis TaxID=254787 RepID=M7N6T2_9MICC|nr:Aminoglycoside 3'-phosphotransferase [Paeniglutamicibacter gangotriensis Lz1y]